MIEVRDLANYYSSIRAVDGLTFDVRPGVVTGFLGPNGAGNSTTMPRGGSIGRRAGAAV